MARRGQSLCDNEDRNSRRSRSPEVRQNLRGSSGLSGQRRGNTGVRPTSSVEYRSDKNESLGEAVRYSREGREPERGRRPTGRSDGASAQGQQQVIKA